MKRSACLWASSQVYNEYYSPPVISATLPSRLKRWSALEGCDIGASSNCIQLLLCRNSGSSNGRKRFVWFVWSHDVTKYLMSLISQHVRWLRNPEEWIGRQSKHPFCSLGFATKGARVVSGLSGSESGVRSSRNIIRPASHFSHFLPPYSGNNLDLLGTKTGLNSSWTVQW